MLYHCQVAHGSGLWCKLVQFGVFISICPHKSSLAYVLINSTAGGSHLLLLLAELCESVHVGNAVCCLYWWGSGAGGTPLWTRGGVREAEDPQGM
jgi:hypothetical protein